MTNCRTSACEYVNYRYLENAASISVTISHKMKTTVLSSLLVKNLKSFLQSQFGITSTYRFFDPINYL